MSMRGYGFLQVGRPEQQAFLEVPEPVPGPGELLVRVRAAGVNPGDWRMREGFYGTAGPAVLGREVAGTVPATALPPATRYSAAVPACSADGPPRALITASLGLTDQLLLPIRVCRVVGRRARGAPVTTG